MTKLTPAEIRQNREDQEEYREYCLDCQDDGTSPLGFKDWRKLWKER